MNGSENRIVSAELEQLNKSCVKIRENTERIFGNIERLYKEIEELSTVWQGRASDSFFKSFILDLEFLREVLAELQGTSRDFENACEIYDRCEKRTEDIIKALNF